MPKQRRSSVVDRQQVQGLLRKYACPVPYHEVRTRFLGSIASPELSASPLQIVKNLWGGTLPEFELIEDLNRLIDTLINGLWNTLTVHQKRNEPFRLVKVPLEPSVANLANLALIRRQEIDGFVEGLFGGSEEIDLPERANASLGMLAEMRGMVAGAHDLTTREAEPQIQLKFMRHSGTFANSRGLWKGRSTLWCSTAPARVKGRPRDRVQSSAAWAPRPRVDNAMVKALARAFRWRKMLDTGVHATLEDLARAKRVAPSYVSRHSAADAARAGDRRGDPRWSAAGGNAAG